MRLATQQRAHTPRLVAAAVMLVAIAMAAPGQANDHDSKTGGCCSMKSSASMAKAPASCAMTGTAACPPGMCSASKSASATAASVKGACPHGAMTSGAGKTTRLTRTAPAPHKRSLKSKAAAKPATGSTAVNVTAGTAGLVAIIDPQTGLVVQATAEQIGQLSAAPKPTGGVSIAARPSDTEVIALPGGGQMVRLPDRLMMNAVAHRDAHGKITYSCQQGNGAIAPLPAEVPAPATPSTWEAK